jgi:hypothetical protein
MAKNKNASESDYRDVIAVTEKAKAYLGASKEIANKINRR